MLIGDNNRNVGFPVVEKLEEESRTGRFLSEDPVGATDERRVVVLLDGVPLFDLAGLLPPLEQLSLPGRARADRAGDPADRRGSNAPFAR